MSKMIAVCGSPGSGKSTASLKIAQELYYEKKGTILFLSPDINIPAMAYIFPHSKDSDLFSIGKALDKTSIFKEDVMKQIVSVKTMLNFGFLGYKASENKFSYPRPTEDKVLALFRAMKEIADYSVIDCTSDPDDLISRMAMTEADSVVQMITPDIKCMGYYSSQADIFNSVADRSIKVLCICDRDLYLPTDEVKAHFKNIDYTLPYSRPLKQQVITGTLSERLADRKYREQIAEIAKKVV